MSPDARKPSRLLSDADLEDMLRGSARSAAEQPAPLDPERARAIFERALALSGVEEAEAGAPVAPAPGNWRERLRAVLAGWTASPASGPRHRPQAPSAVRWGAFSAAAVAGVLLVAVAVTPPDRKDGGADLAARAGAGTDFTPGGAARLTEVAAAAADGQPQAAKPVAARLAAAPAVPAESGNTRPRPVRNRREQRSRRGAAERSVTLPKKWELAPKDAKPFLLPDDEPVLMVASNLPGGEDAERLVVSVRENAPADLPGFAAASALREVPIGPAGPAGLPGTEGPARPEALSDPESITIVWAECVVATGEPPRVAVTPVFLPEPLPEPLPDEITGPEEITEFENE